MLKDNSLGDHTLIHYYEYYYVNLEWERLHGCFGADLM